MKILLILLSAFIIASILISCSCEDRLYDLPEGNLTKIDSIHSPNRSGNDVAPIQRHLFNFTENPCIQEFTSPSYQFLHGIKPSSIFFNEFFKEDEFNKDAIRFLTENVESMTFINRNAGFTALSHPPSKKYSRLMSLPIIGSTGGTDIFEFHYKNGQFEFVDIGKPINSEFWDSHPFIISDGFGTDLLIWSSDRKDNLLGYSEPYSNKGNTDLYYAFRKDGNWSKVSNFSAKIVGEDTSTFIANDINTIYDEQTPSLYCICYNPILLFSSNRKRKDSTFDLYYTRIEIDFINQNIRQLTPVHELKSSIENFTINTNADEKFPIIPNPVGEVKHVYFTSNRFSDEFKVKDTIIGKRKTKYYLKNVGGYDLYRTELDSVEFRCAGIPPKLFLIVHLDEISLNYNRDTIYHLKDVPNSTYKLNSSDKITREKYEIELGKEYKIKNFVQTDECQHGFCKEINLKTPEKILKDTTIEVTLTCVIQVKPPQYVNYSYEKGLAFFITGYWWPTTTENYRILLERTKSKCLTLSNFIDSTDYKPNDEPFYIAAAKVNDEFLNNELYVKIDSVLKLLNKCNSEQKLLITIQGFTDPCPLRTIYNSLGNIIQDSTRYWCDSTIVFNNIVIPNGELMKFPNLRTTEGKPYRLSWGSQQGNVMLAMLRAYYTKQTIEQGFKAKYSRDVETLDKFERFVKFQLDAFGIFDNLKMCQFSYSNIAGLNLINQHYPPEKFEPCNLPHSRRVMIYMDVVNNDRITNFRRYPCEKKPVFDNVAAKREIVIEEIQPFPIDSINLKVLDSSIITKQPTPKSTPCAGICFRIKYGKGMDYEQYEFLKNIIEALGYKILEVEDSKRNFDLISQMVYDSEEEAEKNLEQFRIDLNKLNGIVDISRFKAEIIRL